MPQQPGTEEAQLNVTARPQRGTARPHAPQGGTQAPEVPPRHTQAGSSPCSPQTGPCTLTYGKALLKATFHGPGFMRRLAAAVPVADPRAAARGPPNPRGPHAALALYPRSLLPGLHQG